MNIDQVLRQTVMGNLPDFLHDPQGHNSNPAEDLVTLGSAAVGGLEAHAGGLLRSVAPVKEQQGEVHADPQAPRPHVSAIGNLAKSFAGSSMALVGNAANAAATAVKSSAGSSAALVGNVAGAAATAIESSAGNPVALVGNVAGATVSAIKSSAEDSVTLAGNVASTAATAIESSVGNPVALVDNVAGVATTAIKSSAESSVALVGNVASTAISTIESSAENSVALAGNAASTAATAIESSARNPVALVGSVATTATTAIESSAGSSVALVGNITSTAANAIESSAGNSVALASNTAIAAATAIESSVGNPVAFVGNVAGAATTAIESSAGSSVALVGNVANTAVSAIESSAENSAALAGNAASTAVTAVESSVGNVGNVAGIATTAIESSVGSSVALVGNVANTAITTIESSTGNSVALVGNAASAVAIAIESSKGNPVTLVGNVARAAVSGATEAIEDQAKAFILARIRAIIFSYLAKLPFVGHYFVDKRRAGVFNVESLITETTPLLGALREPSAFATQQAEGILRRVLSPVLNRLPNVDALDNAALGNHCALFKIFVECYVLAKDGSRWFFSHLQEHSLVVAPTVSLGHLSTTDLAASTIGTAVASVTGYSIIQGFISSLDKVLAGAPDRHSAKMACAQAAVVTGIVLFPITNLWAVQSATLLQRFGQPPEVAGPASEFLKITATGLPGYAIGEIAKRYLTSQGLSHVHTRILSAIAPLNVALNYLLVDGPIPALRLGFAGAPLCTVLSHNALAIMLIIYIVQRAVRDEVQYLRGQNTVPDEPIHVNSGPARPTGDNHSEVTFFTGLRAMIFAGLAGVLTSASQFWSKDFGGVVAGILGPNALATQAVLLTTATTLYQAPKALGNASSDRIKKWIAKGDVQRAKIAATVAFVATLGGVFVINNVLLAFATSWGKLFNSDPIIIESVAGLLPVIAAFQAVHGIGAWVDSSLGSLGKTAMFPSLNASADYFLGIPLGVYLAFPRQWGLAGLWVGLTVSLAYTCLVATIVLVRSNWKNAVGERGKAVTREEVEEVRPMNEPRGFGTFA